jgi:hypothetical protein
MGLCHEILPLILCSTHLYYFLLLFNPTELPSFIWYDENQPDFFVTMYRIGTSSIAFAFTLLEAYLKPSSSLL